MAGRVWRLSTKRGWATAEVCKYPRFMVVNRLDRERASLERTLESLRATLGSNCVPVQLTMGEEKNFNGVIDLVAMKAYTFANDESGKVTEGPVPPAMAADATAGRDALIEVVAEADDGLMERFFEAGTLTQEELTSGLGRSIRAGTLYPVFCASALRNIGVQPLADALIDYVPAPSERPFSGQNSK